MEIHIKNITGLEHENLPAFANEFVQFIQTSCPELIFIHGENCEQLIVDRINSGITAYNKGIDITIPLAEENARTAVFDGFHTTYYSEVESLVEKRLPEFQQYLEKDDLKTRRLILASIAAKIYHTIHGLQPSAALYVGPYQDGHTDIEEEFIYSVILKELIGEEENGLQQV